jgi:hypothetical protein
VHAAPSFHRSTAGDRRKERRWPLWRTSLLVLAPLTLLALLGVHWLWESSQAVLSKTQSDTGRGLAQELSLFESGLRELRATATAPKSFLSPPQPAEPNEAQRLYARALDELATKPEAAIALLGQIESLYPDALAASGVPLLPLAKWTPAFAAVLAGFWTMHRALSRELQLGELQGHRLLCNSAHDLLRGRLGSHI